MESSSSDPTTRFLTALANKLTKVLTQNQVAAIENDNEDIYSNCVDVESAIKFHTFSGQHLFHLINNIIQLLNQIILKSSAGYVQETQGIH